MKHSKKLLLFAVFCAFVIPLLFAGTASAKYVGDNAVPDGAGGWALPDDKGFCATGVKSDGTMIIDLSVGNSRPDCLAKIWPAYATSAACRLSDSAGANVEGSHFWTSTCISGADNTVSISLSGLDRTRYMCEQKGGTWKLACTSNWYAMGPTWSAAPAASSQGATRPGGDGSTGGYITTDGFCYTAIRDDRYDNTTCPKVVAGSPGTGTFGYSWNTTTNACVYAYGVGGKTNAAITNLQGVAQAAGTNVDLRSAAYDTQGECVFAGYSWGVHTNGGGAQVIMTANPAGSTIVTPITSVRTGCLSCHNNTTQYNSVAGRWKSDYLKTGHKNMLRKVTAGQPWAGPDADGVIVPYAAAAAGQTLNFAAGTATGSYGTKQLMYLFGDWMAPAPDGLDTVVWRNDLVPPAAKYNGTSDYSCASCHTTGWRNDNTSVGLCSLSSKTTQATCVAALGTWYPMSGAEGYGHGGAEPVASWPLKAIGSGTGTDPYRINGITGQWDWDGINCNRCHKVAYDPTLPINDEGVNAPPGFTTHETDIFDGWKCVSTCFGCHQSIAKTANGTGADADLSSATIIPTKNNKTYPAYQPEFNSHVLGASFLNSPHGQYTGAIVPNSLGKYDLVAGGTFASAFKGSLCRSSTTPGSGSILETQANGEVIKTLQECNVANGKTTNLDNNFGYWQQEDQGSCITCHNVHESLFVADAKEPLRRECTTCHAKPLDDMRHPNNANTPAALAGADAAVACEICHMPKATSGGFPMHLWRVNTSAVYRTFPTAAEFRSDNAALATKRVANTSPDGSYTQAVWVDVDYACGQCHGGGTDNNAPAYAVSEKRVPGPYYNKATLASFAANMHLGAASNTAPVAAFAAAPAASGFTASFTDASTDAETPAGLAITVNWGDGNTSTGAGGALFSHTYTVAGTFNITLTAADAGGLYGYATAKVTVPQKLSISGAVLDVGGSPFAGALVAVKLNGVTKASMTTAADGLYSFTNLNPNTTYTVLVYKYGMTFDGDAAAGTQNPIAVPLASASVTGKDFTRVGFTIQVNTSPALSSVTIYLKQSGATKATATTDAGGSATFTVNTGTYQVQAVRSGYLFDGDPVAAGNQNPLSGVTGAVGSTQTVTFTHTP